MKVRYLADSSDCQKDSMMDHCLAIMMDKRLDNYSVYHLDSMMAFRWDTMKDFCLE
jgi:hypothetical protein